MSAFTRPKTVDDWCATTGAPTSRTPFPPAIPVPGQSKSTQQQQQNPRASAMQQTKDGFANSVFQRPPSCRTDGNNTNMSSVASSKHPSEDNVPPNLRAFIASDAYRTIMEKFDQQRALFSSTAVCAEAAFREVCDATAKDTKRGRPNPVRSAVACGLMKRLLPSENNHAGHLMHELAAEMARAIFDTGDAEADADEEQAAQDAFKIGRGAGSGSGSGGSSSSSSKHRQHLQQQLDARRETAARHQQLLDAEPFDQLMLRPLYFQQVARVRDALYTAKDREIKLRGTIRKQTIILDTAIDRWQQMLVRRVFVCWHRFVQRHRASRYDRRFRLLSRNKRREALSAHFSAWRHLIAATALARHNEEIRFLKLEAARNATIAAKNEMELQTEITRLIEVNETLASSVATLKDDVTEIAQQVEEERRRGDLACRMGDRWRDACLQLVSCLTTGRRGAASGQQAPELFLLPEEMLPVSFDFDMATLQSGVVSFDLAKELGMVAASAHKAGESSADVLANAAMAASLADSTAADDGDGDLLNRTKKLQQHAMIPTPVLQVPLAREFVFSSQQQRQHQHQRASSSRNTVASDDSAAAGDNKKVVTFLPPTGAATPAPPASAGYASSTMTINPFFDIINELQNETLSVTSSPIVPDFVLAQQQKGSVFDGDGGDGGDGDGPDSAKLNQVTFDEAAMLEDTLAASTRTTSSSARTMKQQQQQQQQQQQKQQQQQHQRVTDRLGEFDAQVLLLGWVNATCQTSPLIKRLLDTKHYHFDFGVATGEQTQQYLSGGASSADAASSSLVSRVTRSKKAMQTELQRVVQRCSLGDPVLLNAICGTAPCLPAIDIPARNFGVTFASGDLLLFLAEAMGALSLTGLRQRYGVRELTAEDVAAAAAAQEEAAQAKEKKEAKKRQQQQQQQKQTSESDRDGGRSDHEQDALEKTTTTRRRSSSISKKHGGGGDGGDLLVSASHPHHNVMHCHPIIGRILRTRVVDVAAASGISNMAVAEHELMLDALFAIVVFSEPWDKVDLALRALHDCFFDPVMTDLFVDQHRPRILEGLAPTELRQFLTRLFSAYVDLGVTPSMKTSQLLATDFGASSSSSSAASASASKAQQQPLPQVVAPFVALAKERREYQEESWLCRLGSSISREVLAPPAFPSSLADSRPEIEELLLKCVVGRVSRAEKWRERWKHFAALVSEQFRKKDSEDTLTDGVALDAETQRELLELTLTQDASIEAVTRRFEFVGGFNSSGDDDGMASTMRSPRSPRPLDASSSRFGSTLSASSSNFAATDSASGAAAAATKKRTVAQELFAAQNKPRTRRIFYPGFRMTVDILRRILKDNDAKLRGVFYSYAQRTVCSTVAGKTVSTGVFFGMNSSAYRAFIIESHFHTKAPNTGLNKRALGALYDTLVSLRVSAREKESAAALRSSMSSMSSGVFERQARQRDDIDLPPGLISLGDFCSIIVFVALSCAFADTKKAFDAELIQSHARAIVEKLKPRSSARRVERDAFQQSVDSFDVQRVFEQNNTQLRRAFQKAAAADGDPDMDVQEFMFVMRTTRLQVIVGPDTLRDIFARFAGGMEGSLLYRDFLDTLAVIAVFVDPNPFVPLATKIRTLVVGPVTEKSLPGLLSSLGCKTAGMS